MTHAALSSEDPRTERVKHALRNTLFIALQNEPLHQLTVSTLTRKAKVSRGVFYKHFETLDDLVVDTLVQKIEGALANTSPFREGPIPYLQALFHFVTLHRQIYIHIYPSKASEKIHQDFQQRLDPVCYYYAKRAITQGFVATETALDTTMVFLRGGLLALLEDWIKRNPYHSAAQAEQEAEHFVRLILQFLEPEMFQTA